MIKYIIHKNKSFLRETYMYMRNNIDDGFINRLYSLN